MIKEDPVIKKNMQLAVVVSDLSSEGKGVSKQEDGFVIFSDSTLPGDEALVKIRKKKSNYAEARLVEIIRPSEFRTTPQCDYFGVCGGCKLQNYIYKKQIEYKRDVVSDALLRIGKFSNVVIPDALGSDDIFYYRNKMEFSFSDDEWLTKDQLGIELPKSKFALGLHVPKFHSKIVNVEKCWLQSELSNGILNFTRKFFIDRKISVYSTFSHSGYLRFLVIRQSFNTNDLMVNLITYDFDEDLMKEYSTQLLYLFPGITTLINSTTKSRAQVAFGEKEYVIHGSGFITEKLISANGSEFDFRISSKSFFQTNTVQAGKLFDKTVEFCEFKKTDNVLDLYCGTGSISIFISGLVNKVLGVELVNESIEDARLNAKLNDVTNAGFICSDILDFIRNNDTLHEYNKLILDPPRSGLHPKICEVLANTDFERIVYVSCNPHTQARDLQIICSQDRYSIEKVQPVDMFPHTYHVENIISLIHT